MAQGDSSDILMKFVLEGHKHAIAGESSTELDTGKERSPLLKGFEKFRMFEIDNFRFAVGIEDDTGGDAKAKAAQAAQALRVPGQPNRPQPAAGHPAAAVAGAARHASSGQFQAWRNGHGNVKYGVQVQPITFTRPIDRASISLLQYCINCTTFESAALVKRKATGGPAAGEAYLRMDFSGGVLITDVSWTNDDPVTETCKFISRAVTVQYRPQLPDGSLGIIRHGSWSMRPWDEVQP